MYRIGEAPYLVAECCNLTSLPRDLLAVYNIVGIGLLCFPDACIHWSTALWWYAYYLDGFLGVYCTYAFSFFSLLSASRSIAMGNYAIRDLGCLVSPYWSFAADLFDTHIPGNLSKAIWLHDWVCALYHREPYAVVLCENVPSLLSFVIQLLCG